MARSSMEDLQVEYTRLFIYAHGGSSCSPYESVYAEQEKSLMGESALAVKRFYRVFKLRISHQFKDLQDHISAELEFMHFLSLNEGKFAASGQNRERDLCIQN